MQNAQIDFVDDREGCLFIAIVHRKSIEELAFIKNVANGSIDTAKVSGKRPKSVGKELKASGKRAKNVGKELKKCQERAGSVGKESRKRRVRTEKTTDKILNMCRERPSITISELAEVIGVTERTIQRNIQKLQADQLLIRSGGRKTGFWEVVE
jgi:ATP-dependent DNA helicase RecG